MDFKRSFGTMGVLAIAVALVVGFIVGHVAAPTVPEDVVTQDELQEVEGRLTEEIFALEERLAESVDVPDMVEFPDQPWPYEELDVEEVRKLGHLGYYEDACSYGAFNAIIKPLQDEIGYPYTQVPTYMLHFGRGGIAGDESVCGALLGTVAAMNLIAGEDYAELVPQVIDYYKEAELPTDISNQYAANHEFLVDEYLSDEVLPQTVAGSINCDVSKEVWIEASGYEMGDTERRERCARITGDIAAKGAEILNAWAREVAAEPEPDVDPMAKFEEIFPAAAFDLLEDEVYEVTEDNEPEGYISIGSDQGYEDVIRVAVGVRLDETLAGVRIIQQSETPGIGDEITGEDFLVQFEGLELGDVRVTDDDGEIDVVSGATVSCEVVVDIVRQELERLINYVRGGG